MKALKNLYLNNRFFYALTGIIFLFIIGFLFPIFFSIAKGFLIVFTLLILVDYLYLYSKKQGINAKRHLPDRFSNGDENVIKITLTNSYNIPTKWEIIDELPVQFQERNFGITDNSKSSTSKEYQYIVKPFKRGEYNYGRLLVFIESILGFLTRRYIFDEESTVPTYPSFIQMRKYEMIAFSNQQLQYGIKKVRRIGQTMEFDQIKNYVLGDDIRHINWKATSKSRQLMVNQYQDEQSQPIYCIIDKGRVMRAPFDGMTLLDYAINTTLAISKIAIRKQDRAGIMTFSHKVENTVVAEKRNVQMNLIMETLYNIRTDFKETDFGRLYAIVKSKLTHRSLLLIFSNFETMDALKRQQKYLVAMAKNHLVVVIFFKNSELTHITHSATNEIVEVFDKAVAEKMEYEKRLIVAELKKYGIHSVLTAPQDLTIDTINKYLELKARGLF